jgi:hypothetical protein
MNVKYLLTAASVMAAMPAMAQIPVTASTNISISGLLAVGLKSSQVDQGNALTNRALAPELGVYDNTSRLIFTSTSEIQPGWNVIFRLENRFTANARPGDALLPAVGSTTSTTVVTGVKTTGNPVTAVTPTTGTVTAYNLTVSQATGWADGDTWGGISTPYGNLYAGKSTLYYTDTISAGYLAPSLEQPGESYRIWDCNGLATFNLLSSLNEGKATNGVFTPSAFYNILGNGRSRNVVRYDSPTYKPDAGSLLNFSLAWSKNPTAAQVDWTAAASAATGTYYENGQAYYLKGLYNGHGFSASASYLDDKFMGVLPSAANTELKAIRLGLSYKWQGLKVGVVMDNADMVNGITVVSGTASAFTDAKRTTIEVPISYTFDKHGVYVTYTTAGNNNGFANTGAKQLNVGYDYALTKRAFVGVMYTSINNDSNAMYEGFLTGYSPFGGSNVAQMGESFKQISVLLNYWF